MATAADDERAWLAGTLEAAIPLVGDVIAASASTLVPSASGRFVAATVVRSDLAAAHEAAIERGLDAALPDIAERFVLPPRGPGRKSPPVDALATSPLVRPILDLIGASDGVAIWAPGPASGYVTLATFERLPVETSRASFLRWSRLSAHLADAIRDRIALPRRPANVAVAAWRSLVDGRSSLVDHFDHAGRRFLFVRPNRPSSRASGRLTEREREVVAYLLAGHANKVIAYELGLPESTISSVLRSAARKLGARSRLELVRLFGA
jgi:DNA-binding CsgD family transcriptional regulator